MQCEYILDRLLTQEKIEGSSSNIYKLKKLLKIVKYHSEWVALTNCKSIKVKNKDSFKYYNFYYLKDHFKDVIKDL